MSRALRAPGGTQTKTRLEKQTRESLQLVNHPRASSSKAEEPRDVRNRASCSRFLSLPRLKGALVARKLRCVSAAAGRGSSSRTWQLASRELLPVLSSSRPPKSFPPCWGHILQCKATLRACTHPPQGSQTLPKARTSPVPTFPAN